MSPPPYTPPKFGDDAFHCPHCGTFAHQRWDEFSYYDAFFVVCQHCNQSSIWIDKKLIWPSWGTAPLPNQDLPDHVKATYEEAKNISTLSPRAAAALLRLALEQIAKDRDCKKANLNENIKTLIEKEGLGKNIQKMCKAVRLAGNEAVHAGQIDLNDKPETVNTLFILLNRIAERIYTEGKETDEVLKDVEPPPPSES